MKNRDWILLAVLVSLAVLPARGGDGEEIEPPEDKQTVEILTGGQGSDVDGSLTRVAEYSIVDDTALAGLKWETSPYDDTTFGFSLFRVTSDEFKGTAELDLNRQMRIKGTLDGFIHRLVHDPVTNLQAVSDVKVVRSTDLDPGTDYQINTRLFDVRAEFQPPSTPGFSFRGGYSNLERHGTKQVLSTSHCTGCHTSAQGRDVDESTADAEIGVHLTTGKIDLDYKVYGTDYTNRSRPAVADYESAIHPGNQNDALFDDRVWFQDGLYSVNNIPNVSRLGHQLKLRAGFGKASAVNFTAVQSETQNQRTNLEYEFGAVRGRYSTRLGKRWRFNVFGQHQQLENDSYFVDLVALNGLTTAPVAGPPGYAGISFQDWRQSPTGGNDPDAVFNSFTRNSAMNRTQDRVGVDATWRAMRRASMRVGYKYQRVDRDNVVLAGGDGVTSSHTLKLGWNQRWRNRVRWNNSLRYTATDNPYVSVDGGLRLFSGDVVGGIVDGQAPSPKSPASLQYYQLHELRVANLSSMPTADFSLRSTLNWGPKRASWSIGANVRYRDAENDELQYTQWQRDDVGVGANFWIAAAPKVRVMVGVDSSRQETNSEVIVPVMDG
jgi:hypothetical protein